MTTILTAKITIWTKLPEQILKSNYSSEQFYTFFTTKRNCLQLKFLAKMFSSFEDPDFSQECCLGFQKPLNQQSVPPWFFMEWFPAIGLI